MIELYQDLCCLMPEPLTRRELTNYIRSLLRSIDKDIKVYSLITADVVTITVTGLYDHIDDYEGYPCVSIFLNYPKGLATSRILFSSATWTQFCASLVEVLGHELIHRDQTRNRNFKAGKKYKPVPCTFVRSMPLNTDAEQEYLGSSDEIEAYGFSLAFQEYILGARAGIDKITTSTKSEILYDYYWVFAFTNSKVVTKLLDCANKYLYYLGERHA